MQRKGNVLIFSVFFIIAILMIFLFILIIYISETNSLLYNLKLDMYSFNKAAIISVNKGITSRSNFSYDKSEYRKFFEEMLKKNYHLNDNLENPNGLIQNVKVLEYDVFLENTKDYYVSNKYLDDTVIHSVIEVQIKPVILEEFLRDLFIFEIHEDVNLNMLQTEFSV